MAGTPQDDLAELVRLVATHLGWQRELGAEGFPRGELPIEAPERAASEDPLDEVAMARAGAPAAEAKPPPSPVTPAPVRVELPWARAPEPPVLAPAPPLPRRPPETLSLFGSPGPEPSAASEQTDGPGPALPRPERLAALRIIDDEVRGCTRCRLARTRTHTVFERGDSFARICFVGEGPGEQEDLQGLPFVGPAGQLLDRIIAAAGLQESATYICNIVKCRPPGNRVPESDEMTACTPYLVRQLRLVQPEVIVALGRTAASFLLRSKEPMGKLRGRWHSFEGIPVLPTWHPAYLLRNPAAKPDTWRDIKLVLERLGLPVPSR